MATQFILNKYDGTPLWFGDNTYVNLSKYRLFGGYTIGYATLEKQPNNPNRLRLHVSETTQYYDKFGRPSNKFNSSSTRTTNTYLKLSHQSIFGRRTEGTFWLNAGGAYTNFPYSQWEFIPAR